MEMQKKWFFQGLTEPDLNDIVKTQIPTGILGIGSGSKAGMFCGSVSALPAQKHKTTESGAEVRISHDLFG